MEEMQQNVTPETPAMNTLPLEPGAEKKHVTGPVVAIVILVAAVILGGFYIWGSMLPEDTVDENLGATQRPSTAAAPDVLTGGTTTTTTRTTTTTGPLTAEELAALEKEIDAAAATSDGSADIDAALKP